MNGAVLLKITTQRIFTVQEFIIVMQRAILYYYDLFELKNFI